ncbi:hypothetical protein EJD97_002308, partial [Solanum chilense]
LKYFLLIPLVTSLSFNFDTFTPNDHNVTYERDASPENGAILITKNLLNHDINASIGRAIYSKPLHLWDKASQNLTDFTTHFSFSINSQGATKYGDDFAFFLAPAGSTIPYNTTRGGSLGLTSNNERLNSSINHFVSVEFDTYQNPYDPKGDHVGIDINSMQSLVNVTWFSSIPNDNMTDTGVTLSNTKPEDAPTKTKLRLVVGLICGGCVLVAVCTLVLFAFWRKSKEEMLGRGGFGGVHKGYLSEYNSYIAFKRVSRESKQGIKDGKSHLEWPIRFKIAQGLASALLYLHEEWEQCVVHRDIKSTNIMLDSNYNAKLGDFGLARLVEHGKGSETTVLAGTMGYMAPECVTTGKANKETNVYSFGIVVLEIGCGRKPIDPKAEEHRVNIVDWLWRLYEMIKSS